MKASSVRHTHRILKINNENPGYDFSKMILFRLIYVYSNLFSIFYSLFSVSGLLVHLRLDLLNRKEREREESRRNIERYKRMRETNRDIEGKEETKKWRKIEREKNSTESKKEKKTGQKQ